MPIPCLLTGYWWRLLVWQFIRVRCGLLQLTAINEQKNRTPANLRMETKSVESVESVDWIIPVRLCVVVMIIDFRLCDTQRPGR